MKEPEEFEEEPAPRRRPYGFVALALMLAGAAALVMHDRAADSPPPIVCSDCGRPAGQLHEFGCLKERCPYCGDQLATCDCIKMVLNLNKAERQAVDEHVDDEVEPLKSILARWRAELEKKGRVAVENTEQLSAPK